MGHGHEIHINQEQFVFTKKSKKFSLTLIIIGAILTLIGIFTTYQNSNHAPHGTSNEESHNTHADVKHHEHISTINILGIDTARNNELTKPILSEHPKPWYTRVYLNLMANGYFLMLISICGVFFFALQFIANAGWATSILRVPLAIGTIFPVGALIILLVFLIDGNNIYHWKHYEHLHITDTKNPNYDAILASKQWFLNTPLILGFMIGIPIVWFLFNRVLRKYTFTEDEQGGTGFFDKTIRYSAAFTFVFGFTLSIMTWVVSMAIDSHWYSTIFSIYNFATGWVSCLTIIMLMVLFLKRQGYLSIVTDEHIHDLGKFMFAFSIFWTYLWLSQYLLIWYANIPEESVYFYKRLESPFKVQYFMNLVLNFLIPFLFLMTRNNKRNPKILTFVGICILVGHWNDIHLMLMPGAINENAGIGVLEIGMAMFFVGLFIYWVLTALSQKGLIPVKHPYINESAHHDVGV